MTGKSGGVVLVFERPKNDLKRAFREWCERRGLTQERARKYDSKSGWARIIRRKGKFIVEAVVEPTAENRAYYLKIGATLMAERGWVYPFGFSPIAAEKLVEALDADQSRDRVVA